MTNNYGLIRCCYIGAEVEQQCVITRKRYLQFADGSGFSEYFREDIIVEYGSLLQRYSEIVISHILNVEGALKYLVWMIHSSWG